MRSTTWQVSLIVRKVIAFYYSVIEHAGAIIVDTGDHHRAAQIT
jgi:hypothetical protein